MPDCTAILVTRGDVDLTRIYRSLCEAGCFRHILTWDDSDPEKGNLGPWGQWHLALSSPKAAETKLCYFQDDDCLADPRAIVEAWEPGRIVCNMPPEHQREYVGKPDALMGFGSCFEHSWIFPTFRRYLTMWESDDVLRREPGRIFTALNRERVKIVDAGVEHLPWATADNRLYRQPDHGRMRDEARRRVAEVLRGEHASAV